METAYGVPQFAAEQQPRSGSDSSGGAWSLHDFIDRKDPSLKAMPRGLTVTMNVEVPALWPWRSVHVSPPHQPAA